MNGNWYPKAIRILADPSNYRTCVPKRATFNLIVPHITSGRARAEDTAAMWQQFNHKSSAHFVIGQDGTVIQSVDLGDIAWHAHGANALSVGIEHAAREPNEPSFPKGDPGLPLSGPQLAASAELIAWLCRLAGLPIDRAHIRGHNEVDRITTHIGCPTSVAGGWDLDAFVNQRVQQAARDLAAQLLE